MADYYPLIARAVAGLDMNTGENRRALYERARAALVNQLRGVDPPLEESDITRERLALEEAIRKLETEAGKRVRPEAADAPKADEAHDTEEHRHSLRDQGLRDFRDTVAESQGLGLAASEANRSARAAYEDMQGEHGDEHRHDHARDDAQGRAGEAFGDSAHDSGETYFDPSAPEPSMPEGGLSPAHDAPHSGGHALPEPRKPDRHAATPDDDDYSRPAQNYGRIAKIALLLLVIGGVAGAGYWQRDAIVSAVKITMASLFSSPPAPASKPATAASPTSRPKIEDRVGASDTNAPSASATAPAAAVAQKVVLYDEDPADPKGKRYVGSAVWRTETVSPGPGLAPELAIRADVEIPERRMRMIWSLRRNTDKALPASHTIEVMFTLPADFAEGGIGNVPGVLMKQNEGARGVPLAGLAVKVTNGYFLIGLSAAGGDLQRNVQSLKERDWFDIPIVYASGKRAILAVEKGTPGGRAFEEAFRAWGQ